MFEKGIRFYVEQKFTKAIDLFSQILKLDPKDKAVELCLKRFEFYSKFGVDPNWEGIETLDFKEDI